MVKICPKCGNNNSDDAFWCINCNSKISNGLNIIQKKDNTISIVIVGFNQLNSDEEKFIGTWESSNSEGTMTFESGFFSKTVTFDSPTTDPIKGSWRCENGKLYIEFDLENIKANSCNIYTFDEDQIISNPCEMGEQVILTRK